MVYISPVYFYESSDSMELFKFHKQKEMLVSFLQGQIPPFVILIETTAFSASFKIVDELGQTIFTGFPSLISTSDGHQAVVVEGGEFTAFTGPHQIIVELSDQHSVFQTYKSAFFNYITYYDVQDYLAIEANTNNIILGSTLIDLSSITFKPFYLAVNKEYSFMNDIDAVDKVYGPQYLYVTSYEIFTYHAHIDRDSANFFTSIPVFSVNGVVMAGFGDEVLRQADDINITKDNSLSKDMILTFSLKFRDRNYIRTKN